ncbi:TonB-dependent receptor [Sphingomonas nostoxanthinifaciens]|uniref:TonB-dependent receptor n=1 Tax=Sphingomonas nostoxanthinifaciens TaxID=2872652 RepID=UPI001CC21515|nr:TonB-dependent receptor [Sphingomonas nostoxanthinifaciens]UAK26288.1 TonB-dependent receptor [Sphingomonas nostoxanthinifaciens]
MLALSSEAYAEPAAAAAAPSVEAPADADVGEITVTARYRQESAQKVPIGITALSASTLAEQGAFNLKQVVQQLPSLNIQGYSGRNQTITIRGIGTNAGGTNDGLEQGVGLYVDGVYRPRTGSVITDLIDIDSIQLLRGPQGTLFGKNTVAGAIDIRTREPTFTPEAKAELTYGNYNYLRGYVSLDSKINDTLAFRVSYLRTQRDGLIYNTTYHQDWDNLNNNSARVDLLWKPAPNFKLRLTGDYSIQTGNVGFQSIAAILPTTLANGTQVRGFYRRAADIGYTPLPVDPFARRTDIDSSQYDKMPSWGIQARADWTLSGGTTLTSISAYRRWKWIPNFDGDQLGANISTASNVATDQQQFSQELRLASPGNETIDYTAGLYYFWQKADDTQITGYGRDAATWLTTPNTPTAAVSTLPSAALNGLYAYAHIVPATYSYASYGQATWNISPSLRLTGGLRFTYEHKTGLYDATSGGTVAPIASFDPAIQATVAARRAALAPTGSYNASKDTKNVSGTLVAAYDLSPDLHSYASFSRGYKSPGINLVARSNGIDIFVKPEKVDDYEIGLKSRLFGGKIELNLDLFWSEDSNYQANYINYAVTPVVSYITNVGKLRTRGVEVDARANPARGLTLTASGAYDDARYVSYRNAPAPYLLSYLSSVDLSGRPASGAPKWAVTGTAEYTRQAGSLEAYVGGDASYRSGFYAAVNLDPLSRVAGYALLGAHLGLRQPDARWDVSLWVRNLTDKNYFNTKSISTAYGTVLAALGEPRTFGVTLRGKL